MTGFFIAATGTEVGKTFVASALAWQLFQWGKVVQAIKPVSSGFSESRWQGSDAAQLLEACGQPVTLDMVRHINPWRFSAPVSPHLAAGDAAPTAEAIEDFCREVLGEPCVTLIEGAGGIMTPLVQGYTQMDLVEALDIPVVMVAGNALGTISHTLTALEACHARGIKVLAVLLNETDDNALTPLEDNAEAIRSHARDGIHVVTLTHQPAGTRPAWQNLPPLMELLNHD